MEIYESITGHFYKSVTMYKTGTRELAGFEFVMTNAKGQAIEDPFRYKKIGEDPVTNRPIYGRAPHFKSPEKARKCLIGPPEWRYEDDMDSQDESS